MRVIQCVRSLAKTCGLGIYAIMLPSSGFSVAHWKDYGEKSIHAKFLGCMDNIIISSLICRYKLISFMPHGNYKINLY